MVNPCGIPEAWDLFDKSESPSKILAFIQKHHPQPHQRAQYYIIDKACQLLRYIVTSDDWPTWSLTSRFIVDSYHYINHRIIDYLCRTFCNPAPLNGSAPNLVRVRPGPKGLEYYRAFNTQACVFIAMTYGSL